MRRDVTHYFERDLKSVFDAYYFAATQKFGKNCTVEPFHTISFGINMSFKYNMNGGSCNVHFIPHGSGTAVDVRYAIAQLAGANVTKYDRVLTGFVVDILKVPAQNINIPVDVFLDPANMVTAPPATEQQPVQPARQQPPVQQPMQQRPPMQQPAKEQSSPKRRFCTKCGTKAETGDLFCAECGNRLK